MNELYIPGCTNCPYPCTDDLYNALVRAKVWFYTDRINMVMRIISRNSSAPLTIEEKKSLHKVLITNFCPYTLVFDN